MKRTSFITILYGIRQWLGQWLGLPAGNRCVGMATIVKTQAETKEKKVGMAMICQMESFLCKRYEFRYNRLTEDTEYRNRDGGEADGFQPVTQRDLNSFCSAAQKQGIACWDRDISRFIHSKDIPEYHPFHLYMNTLPEWDGVDRVGELALRVSDRALWLNGFRRWLLAMAAGWLGMDPLHSNSLAPVLVSRKQGRQKSTFCKMLLPDALQRYYTDSIDLNATGQTEQKLALFGLINLDEFDKIPLRKMALLKNLMQMAGLNIRKAYRRSFSPLPRIASFIATSNRMDLLSDPSGSRRFLCVEVERKINCSPIDHAQLYAQLKALLVQGERYWFTGKEETEIMASNERFYRHVIEEDVFLACFRPTEVGEEAITLSAAEIFRKMKQQNPSAMRGISPGNFGKTLMAMGIPRVCGHYGNRYQVVPLP